MQTAVNVAEQYRSSQNLDARVALHTRFSTNAHDWMRWVFDQILADREAPPNSPVAVLEIGCGTGQLWKANYDRVPMNWAVTLTDASTGMLATTQANLAGSDLAQHVQYRQFDANTLPFEAAAFDLIIANHMLYHVPNIDRTLTELRRVLKPGGCLFAATNGPDHMRDLDDLLVAFDPALVIQSVTAGFNLSNGAAQLHTHFAHVALHRYHSDLIVTEPAPLLAYVYSMLSANISTDRRPAFETYVHAQFEKHNGTFHIRKETGIFVANQQK